MVFSSSNQHCSMSKPVCVNIAGVGVKLNCDHNGRTFPLDGVEAISWLTPVEASFASDQFFILATILTQQGSSQSDVNISFGTCLLGLRSALKDLLKVLTFRQLWRLRALFRHQSRNSRLSTHCKLCGCKAVHKGVLVKGGHNPVESFMQGIHSSDLIVIHIDLNSTP